MNQIIYSNGYLKFSDNCLKIYESILTNNFQLIFPLYGAEYDLVRINKKLKIKTISLIDLKEAYDRLKTLVATQKLNEKEIFLKEILSEVNIRLYHPFDKGDFYIRISPDNHKLRDLMKIINIVENLIKQKNSNTRFIKKIDETNSFIYGKIYLEIISVDIDNIPPGINAFAIISMPPYEFKTKTSMTVDPRKLSTNSVQNKGDKLSVSFNESLSNTKCKDSVNSTSKISNALKDVSTTNLSGSISFNNNTDFINNPYDESTININNFNSNGNPNSCTNNIKYFVNNNSNNCSPSSKFKFYQTFVLPIHNKFEKLKIEIYTKNLQGVFAKREIVEKICEYEILIPDIMNSICFGDKKIQINCDNISKGTKSGSKTLINIKIQNCTSILSNFIKNKNKGVLEDMSIEKSEEDLSIKKLFKRLKKILILIKDFKEYYKTIFRFKYPNFSYVAMISSIAYLLFFDIKYFLVHLLFLMFIIAFFQSHYYKKYFSLYTNSYVYGRRNDLDFSGDSLNAMTKIELEDSEVKKDTYLTDKGQKPNLIKIFIEPIKTYKIFRDSYHKVLIKFTRYVSNLEKIKNLFLFTDPIISIYFMAILILCIFLIYSIEFKYLMLYVIVKRFFVGYSYYTKKHINNLEIANLVLKHCHQEYKSKQKYAISHDLHIMKSALNSIINGNADNFNSYSNDNNKTVQLIPNILNNVNAISWNNSNTNNPENKDNIIEFEDIEDKIRQIRYSENMTVSHDIDNVLVFEDKFKLFIKEQLEKHIDLVISNEFLNSIAKMGEIKEVIGKCKGILKIKKDSILFNKTINNPKIYKESLDADQIFIYFIQNVKSDFYLSKFYTLEEEAE
jgi:hypothetical protein